MFISEVQKLKFPKGFLSCFVPSWKQETPHLCSPLLCTAHYFLDNHSVEVILTQRKAIWLSGKCHASSWITLHVHTRMLLYKRATMWTPSDISAWRALRCAPLTFCVCHTPWWEKRKCNITDPLSQSCCSLLWRQELACRYDTPYTFTYHLGSN